MKRHCLVAILTGGSWLLLDCSGCALKPSPLAPVSLPAAFEAPVRSDPQSTPLSDWYRAFGSDELDQLIAEAQRSNLDLAVADANVRRADAQARAAGGAILPSVDADGGVTHYQGQSHGANGQETDWSGLLSASYEIDFWGRNRLLRDSAQLNADSSRADQQTVALTISAGVAETYFQILALREREVLARDSRDAEARALQIIEQRVRFGAASRTDLATQQALLASAELIPTALSAQEQQASGALALLLGRAPEGFRIRGQTLADIHEPAIRPGLPSDLLVQRPDIVAAESGLRAANADIAAARAAMLPNVTLTAAGGVQNPAVQAAVLTLAGAGPTLTVGGTLVQNLFDGGRKRAARDQALAQQQALLAQYRRAILAALLDVESALTSLQQLDAQQPAQLRLTDSSARALASAQERLRAGAADYLPWSEAQRIAYTSHDQEIQYRLNRLLALVALSKALGGGWHGAPTGQS